MLAVGAVVLTGTSPPAKAFAGFANSSVLLVVIAFLVAQAVVKSGLGRRISLFMVSLFGRSSLGLAYSIVLTDAAIAPAFPSNTARGGVLFPDRAVGGARIGLQPEDPEGRRLGGYLMFCAHGEPRGFVRALDDGHVGQSDRHPGGDANTDVEIGFGKWLIAASVPALIGDPGAALGRRPAFPAGRRRDTRSARSPRGRRWPTLGPLSRDEWITAVAFVLMVAGWIFADKLNST